MFPYVPFNHGQLTISCPAPAKVGAKVGAAPKVAESQKHFTPGQQ